MIKIENFEAFNFIGAMRGMRNPLESWAKSDTRQFIYQNAFHPMALNFDEDKYHVCQTFGADALCVEIGPNDLACAQKLILAGSDHRKFMRQIFVSVDITAPLYLHKELETYKVATVANSCSTMHKLATTPITRDLFSMDEENDGLVIFDNGFTVEDSIDRTIAECESLRQKFLATKDKRYWRALIQKLPDSWMQKRTWTGNYEVLRNILFARRNHKLLEWHIFCAAILKLPYGKELIGLEAPKGEVA